MSYRIADDGKSITCTRCERTSYNLSDVRNRYCGFCKLFHNDSDHRLIGGAVYIYRPGEAEPHVVNARMPAKPSLRDIHIVVWPLLDRGDSEHHDMEHVSVLFQDQHADMFVDERGVIDGLPRNDLATAIYRENWMRQHPDNDPESLPHIAGTAVVFHGRRVWS
jgi:hypothetical protein